MRRPYTWICFFLVSGFASLLLINRIILAFSYYSDMGGGEPIFILYIQRFAMSVLYGDPERVPFGICTYTPAYFFLVDKLNTLIGINPQKNIHELYVLLRLLNLGFNILSSYLIYIFLSKTMKLTKSVAAIFAITSFCLFYVQHYAVRPDSLRNIVFIISLMLLYQSCHSGKMWQYALVALLSFSAIFLKQDAIIFIPAVLVFYLVERDISGFKTYLFTFLCLTIFCIALLFNHNLWFENLFPGLNQGISYPHVVKFYKYLMLPRFMFFFTIVICALKWPGSIVKGYHGIIAMASVLLLGAFITSLRWGSTPSYYSEFFQILLVIIAINWNMQFNTPSRILNLAFLMLPVLLIALINYESSVAQIKIFDKSENTQSQLDYHHCREVADWVHHNTKNGPQFDVLTFDKAMIIHVADRCLYMGDLPELMVCDSLSTPENKDYRTSALYNKYSKIREKYAMDSITFFITLKRNCDTSFMAANPDRNYSQKKIGDYYIYMAKNNK